MPTFPRDLIGSMEEIMSGTQAGEEIGLYEEEKDV